MDASMIGGLADSGMKAVGGLMKMGVAIKQMVDAKRLRKELDKQGRPVYKMPEAANESEGMVRGDYLNHTLPGQNLLEDKIGANTANSINTINNTAGSGAEALLAYGLANNQMNNQLNDIAVEAAKNHAAKFGNMINMLGNKAAYQDQMWSYNTRQPYDEKKAKAEALTQAGATNLGNSFSEVGSAAGGITGDVMKAKAPGYSSLLKAGLLKAKPSMNTTGSGTSYEEPYNFG